MTNKRYYNDTWRELDFLGDFLKQAVWSGLNDVTLEEVKEELEAALAIVEEELEHKEAAK